MWHVNFRKQTGCYMNLKARNREHNIRFGVNEEGTKNCPSCCSLLPKSAFGKDLCTRDGFRGRCKKCINEYDRRRRIEKPGLDKNKKSKYLKTHPERYRLQCRRQKAKQKYGLSIETIDEMKQKRNNKCDICGKQEKDPSDLNVDHCHKTDITRGILCHLCNVGLGQIGESVENLARAVAYLESTSPDIPKMRTPAPSTQVERYRGWNLKRQHGINRAQFEWLKDRARGLCQICSSSTRILCVDHCHSTSRIRGLLCYQCNFAIGSFREDLLIMEEAASYIYLWNSVE